LQSSSSRLETQTTATEALRDLVETLSDAEAQEILHTVAGVTDGERYWEDDVAVYFNERIKSRRIPDESGGDLTPLIAVTDEGIFAPVPVRKEYPAAPRMRLPGAEHLDVGLTDVLRRRRSRREYARAPLRLSHVATLLSHAAGVTGAGPGYGYGRLPLRTFPSAGGLQSPELYLFARRVDDLAAGVHHYDTLNHALELIEPGDHGPALERIAFAQPELDDAPAVFFVTGCYERLRWKYGPRAYRYICMDAGFLAQNLQLAAEAMGLGACAIAGFLDDAAEAFVGADGRDELALLFMTVGMPAHA
jgi:SagB-type dehydrogenase family enzyme